MPTAPSDFGRLAQAASGNLGLVSVRDAADLGIGRSRLQRAARQGLLVRVHTDVYRFAAAGTGWRQSIVAATMQVPGSVASHESALGLAGVTQIPQMAAISVEPGRRSKLHGVRIHRMSDLRATHRRYVDGVPTTTVARAVVDLASVFGRARLEFLVDLLTIQLRLTSPAAIGRTLLEVERRGRRQLDGLRNLLDDRRPSGPVERSKLERRFDRLLVGSGLPEPVHELPIPTDGAPAGIADRGWPDAQIIVEIDGRTWHSRERAMRSDRERDRQAARMGWVVLRFLDEEVDAGSESVVADLREVYEARMRQRSGPGLRSPP